MTTEEYHNSIELLNKYAHYYYVLADPFTNDEVSDNLYHEVLAFEEDNANEVLAISQTHTVSGS